MGAGGSVLDWEGILEKAMKALLAEYSAKEDNLKLYYYRGLKEWKNEKGYLFDTCLTAQDRYKGVQILREIIRRNQGKSS